MKSWSFLRRSADLYQKQEQLTEGNQGERKGEIEMDGEEVRWIIPNVEAVKE
jgi:hypothetical protein